MKMEGSILDNNLERKKSDDILSELSLDHSKSDDSFFEARVRPATGIKFSKSAASIPHSE